MEDLIWVVQFEHGGIPEEPEVFLTESSADARWEELVVEQGMRPRKEGESLGDYMELYWEILRMIVHPDNEEEIKNSHLKDEDTVRIWGVEVEP